MISIAIVTFSSCASVSTRVTSEQNFEYQLGAFDTIVITALHKDPNIQRKAETAFAKEFSRMDFIVHLGIEITPPDVEYAPGEIRRIYDNLGIQGVLDIQLTGSDSTVVDEHETRNAEPGNYSGYMTESSGNSISISRRKFAVTLWNLDTAETVWVSTAVTTGNAYAGKSSVLRSLARETARTYRRDVEQETP